MNMSNLDGEETFEVSQLGQAEQVSLDRVCDDELIIIKGYSTSPKSFQSSHNSPTFLLYIRLFNIRYYIILN